MGKAVDQLLSYHHRDDCYTVPFAQVRDLQIAAMNERLQERTPGSSWSISGRETLE